VSSPCHRSGGRFRRPHSARLVLLGPSTRQPRRGRSGYHPPFRRPGDRLGSRQ
jgi:hypothetical protein